MAPFTSLNICAPSAQRLTSSWATGPSFQSQSLPAAIAALTVNTQPENGRVASRAGPSLGGWASSMASWSSLATVVASEACERAQSSSQKWRAASCGIMVSLQMQFCRHAAASPRSSSEARGQAQEAPTQRRGPQAEVDRRRLVYRHGQRDVRRWTGGDAAAASCQLPLPRAHNKATRQAAHSQEKYTNTSRHPVVSLSASVSTASRQCRPGRCVCRPSPCPAFFVRRPRRRWHRLSDCPCDCDSRKSLSWQNLLQNGRETAPASAPTHPARGPSR